MEFDFINPRDFSESRYKQVDDEIYGGGVGMLIKAEPVIQAVESVLTKNKQASFQILYMSPSPLVFDQRMAHNLSQLDLLILVSGRYEGIDYRFVEYMQKTYSDNFSMVSLGKFISLGGEIPAMLVTEAVVRLIPGVIKESESREKESYSLDKNLSNIEYPQYTRPEEVRGMRVPDVLLSGHHKNIEDWKNNHEIMLD
ncbi:MAG: tRNA (guanosine(37)-N1)-methyltransferase TrmD [bacterium]|nr:tRNA (guanosine(37)-N1)-methyltransferase TrmD [bacterium]